VEMETIEETPGTLPMTDTAEFSDDVAETPDEDHDLSRAEDEGMTGVPLPIPESLSPALKLAMERLFSVQDRLEAAIDDHAEKHEVAKTAKGRVEALKEDLSRATRALRDVRIQAEPDPQRYPLLDKPNPSGEHSEVNGMFPAPTPIQPLPPTTFAEALRRAQRDTRLDSMGFTARTMKALEALGLTTALDLVNKINEAGERGMDVRTIKGITEARLDEIADRLKEITDTIMSDWDDEHLDQPAIRSDDEDDVA
jgi:hypothetical protein